MKIEIPTARAARIELAYDILLALLVFLLPLSSAFPNILLAPLGILLFFKYDNNKTNYRPVLLFLITISYLIIGALFKGSLFEEFSFYSRLFISLFLIFIVPQASRIKLIEKALIGGVLIALLVASYNILAYQDFQISFANFGNTAVVNELLRIERPYFGFFLAVSVHFLLRHKTVLSSILALIASVFCALIAARLSLGLILILWFVAGYQFLAITKRFRLPILLVISIISGILLFNNDNLRDRFKISGSVDKTLAKALDYEPRYVIWPCTLEVLRNTSDYLFGLRGNAQVIERLTGCYENSITGNPSKKAYFLSEKFNPHNQFLHVLDLAGMVAFILLLAAFIRVFISAGISFEKKLFLLLFMLFFAVEAVLFRQLGCYFVGLGLGYLAKNTKYNPA